MCNTTFTEFMLTLTLVLFRRTTKPLPNSATNTDYDTLTMTAFTTTPICNSCWPFALSLFVFQNCRQMRQLFTLTLSLFNQSKRHLPPDLEADEEPLHSNYSTHPPVYTIELTLPLLLVVRRLLAQVLPRTKTLEPGPWSQLARVTDRSSSVSRHSEGVIVCVSCQIRQLFFCGWRNKLD
jgi:hypothetical protein